MDIRTLSVLEFPKVLARLSGFAVFGLGKERALALSPASNIIEARRRQRLVRDARRLFEIRGSMTVGGARDVREVVSRAALGGRLEPPDLLEIRSTLESGRVLRRTIAALADQLEALSTIASEIPELRGIEEMITRCLDDEGKVVDSASPSLGRMRAEVRSAHNRLIDRLNAILGSIDNRELIQDAIITIRNGRYVIPIKAEARSKFRAIVHDQSSSGATLFVEPLQTVDLNNTWRESQLAEQREVDRILQELSDSVGAQSEPILRCVERLGDLDMILACAHLGATMRASEPILIDPLDDPGASTLLRDARHPLLAGKVVPNTIAFGDGYSILVITGPNTGGKTVALKTAGLLTVMAQAGLQIPASEDSTVRWMDSVYADIGDEQSIEQSLSTFSSHLTHIVDILGKATERSLVLLDELGAGTDPGEGSALARSILEELRERGTNVIGTTHYAELKTYAHTTPGVANANVEFDVESLGPTYRLTIGLPGRSNAFAIAARLGLHESVLARARGMIGEDELRVETLLSEIQEARHGAEAARKAAEREHRRVADLARQMSRKLVDFENQKAAAIETAREEVDKDLASVRESLRDLGRQIERKRGVGEPVAPMMQQTNAIERQLAGLRPSPAAHQRSGILSALKVGDWVRISRIGQIGQILQVVSDQADMQIGSFKTRVAIGELEPVTRAERDASESISGSYDRAVRVPATTMRVSRSELELRGWRAEEVVPELDKYLNDAYMAGFASVRIIHGKGTGVLRQVVRDYLIGHPLVASFNTGERHEGGDGVTVAALAT